MNSFVDATMVQEYKPWYNLKTFEAKWMGPIFLMANGGMDCPHLFHSILDFLILNNNT
jgi:hypothetical protein